MIHPRGKLGIAVSVLVAIILVITINALAYLYLQNYPPSGGGSIFRLWDCFMGIQTMDKGIDTLLLGDSSSRANLDTGAFADRLGGQTIDLSVLGGMSMLADAWLLSAYVQKFGPPDNVVVCRLSQGYNTTHTIELLAAPSLPWGYWDKLGLAPAWEAGEIRELFITKYVVLYSYADVLRERLAKFRDFFNITRCPTVPTNTYTQGSEAKKVVLNLTDGKTIDLKPFMACPDATNAVRFMSDMAREKQFQLYFVFQPEWDEAINAGLRQPIVDAQIEYLSQFTDPNFVHIIWNESLTFTQEQMQNHAHLRPGADHIKTESDISRIISIQNQLTAGTAQPIELDSVNLTEQSYSIGDKPVVELTIHNLGSAGVNGSVSCLAKPCGVTDGYWVSRAPAAAFELEAGGKFNMNLELMVGAVDETGTYDLVVFLRQDVGNLSNEVRVELPGYIRYSD
jgi:hypothetical protein